MAIASKISSAEILAQLNDRYVDQFFEVALVNSPGVTYVPGGTDDVAFMANEVVEGTGGYYRQIVGYSSGDVAGYADQGIALARKAAVFDHDGSGTALTFSHIVLLRGDGNILTLGTPSATPTNAVDGTYVDLPTTSSGSGQGALLTLTVSGTGTVFSVTAPYPGYNYAAAEVLTVAEADLVTAGVCGVGDGNLTVAVSSVTSGGGAVYSVSKPNTTVNLTDGNQAVMYFDVKHFGFFN